MTGVQVLLNAIATLLGADTATFADPLFLQAFLIKADFAIGPRLILADLTIADFTGNPTKDSTVAGGLVGINPVTTQITISAKTPLGGWRFNCTADPTPGQNIFGVGLKAITSGLLLGVKKYATPILIQSAGDFIEEPDLTFNLVSLPLV
jgi:hypothetical protein